MVEWLIAAAVFVLLMLAMVIALPHLKPPKGGGGFGIALFMILASVLDPAKGAAIEQLDRKKDIEGSEDGESGAGPEPRG